MLTNLPAASAGTVTVTSSPSQNLNLKITQADRHGHCYIACQCHGLDDPAGDRPPGALGLRQLPVNGAQPATAGRSYSRHGLGMTPGSAEAESKT